MQIIKKIEINYFRSAYSASLKNCKDINIFTGGNDAGKSNILKALNLFFNNETELNIPFSFRDDLSRTREVEARAAKGRAFISIKITFRNFKKWKTLPNEFQLKKTWNRYSDQPQLEVLGNTSIAPTILGRFLSSLEFHYVPAVKSIDTFTHYLTMLTGALITEEKTGLSKAAAEIVDRINESSLSMTENIKKALGLESSIEMPRDIKNIFAALDLTTKLSAHHIPLKKRGDGIQARHIPFLLGFIESRSRKSHIWGYEEPENSLEMGKAFKLAEQFQEIFSNQAQIFLSTHSPAFYGIDGPNVSKWLIESKEASNRDAPSTTVTPRASIANFDEALGVAGLIADRAREMAEELEHSRASSLSLALKLEKISLPKVIVEGPSDEKILTRAYELLYPDEQAPCVFTPAGGAQNVVDYLISSANLGQKTSAPLIGLLDNDSAGKTVFNKISKKLTRKEEHTELHIVHHLKKIYVGYLPTPPWVERAEAKIRSLKNNCDPLPVTVETLVSPDFIKKASESKNIAFNDCETTAKNGNFQTKVNFSEDLGQALDADEKYLVQMIENNSKGDFADCFSKKAGAEHCEGFRKLFEWIRAVIPSDSSFPLQSVDSEEAS